MNPARTLLPLAIACVCVAVPANARAAGQSVWHEKAASAQDLVEIPSLAPLVENVSGAVLTIKTEAKPNDDENGGSVFRGFGFEFRLPQMMPMQGQGSGFLIHESGYALTNHHVIENADIIKVNVGGSTEEYPAKVIGTDPKTDVALIKIEGPKDKRWPYIPLGDSDALKIGDYVVAVGNPFGLSQTVSSGIISANHRRNIAPSGRNGLYDFLQTDAAINPGNSGGPLLNLRGEVVGINAAVNAAGQGLGFAIPINLVKKLIPQLKDGGSVERSWIGVGIKRVTPDIAKGLGLDRPHGALVAQVVDGGPADKAGIEPGDVILSFDGDTIEEAGELPLLAAHAGVGKRVKLRVLRDGKEKTRMLKLGRMPEKPGDHPHVKERDDAHIGKIGVRVQDLDDDARERLGLRGNQRGALIGYVAPGSSAQRAGLMAGDVVLKANRRPIGDADDFVRAVQKTPRGGLLKLVVRRGTATVFVPVVKP